MFISAPDNTPTPPVQPAIPESASNVPQVPICPLPSNVAACAVATLTIFASLSLCALPALEAPPPELLEADIESALPLLFVISTHCGTVGRPSKSLLAISACHNAALSLTSVSN